MSYIISRVWVFGGSKRQCFSGHHLYPGRVIGKWDIIHGTGFGLWGNTIRSKSMGILNLMGFGAHYFIGSGIAISLVMVW